MMSKVLNAYFNKYDTQILRWNVESVVEEIEAAAKVQAESFIIRLALK